jgi:hypothetical protein
MARKPTMEDDSFILNHLERYALEIKFDHPNAPTIVKESGKFLVTRQKTGKRPSRCNTLRAALNIVIFDLGAKEASKKLD